jgi:hypothetical protein
VPCWQRYELCQLVKTGLHKQAGLGYIPIRNEIFLFVGG